VALDRLTQNDKSNAEGFAAKGWALEYVGPARMTDALDAYIQAARLDDANLWCQLGVANAQWVLGDRERATAAFRSVLERAGSGGSEGDMDKMGLIGWCHHRLGETDEALQLYASILARDPGRATDQFDLAAALMGGGRYELSLREYERGVDLVRRQDALRRRGLLRVALVDLQTTLMGLSGGAAAPEMKASLMLIQQALSELSKTG
jgi:tetratricopeptide (TPR) repeat protein